MTDKSELYDEKFKNLAAKIEDSAHELKNKIQNIQNVIELKMSDNHKNVADSLQRVELAQAYTNGKVRKITVFLVFLSGIVIGLGFTEAKVLLPLLSL